ncbi:NINE protein [Lewinella sp. 4G2]|uniref:NINE protein n=1 Tax=Lewinella sp. 4G2 TaxID=1803372 RepID=UPI0007DFD2EA|nr:NINE protein [Lewinella sp. 4G2]OAV44911.1 hypothetical protein A3850_010585 [Lewinella sp. 4G2]
MKSKIVAAILAWFLGAFGGHKFYLGQVGRGVLYLVFFWTFIPAIISFFEAIILLTMDDRKFDRLYNGVTDGAGGTTIVVQNYGAQPTAAYNQQPQAFAGIPADRVIRQDNSQAHKDHFEEEGDRLYRDYETREAIPLYMRSLENRSNNPKLHFKLACIHSMHEDTAKALSHLEKAINQGYADFQRINSHDHLSFLRSQSAYQVFKANGYKQPDIEEQIIDEVETPLQLNDDFLGQLERLAKLKEAGILSQEEFAAQKERLLR